MATYTPTGAANLLAAPGNLPERIEIALLQKAAPLVSGALGPVYAYILRLRNNPVGESNAILPWVLAVCQVAAPGTDTAPNAPTDAELATCLNTLWPYLVS